MPVSSQKNKADNHTYLTGLLWGLNEIIYLEHLEQSLAHYKCLIAVSSNNRCHYDELLATAIIRAALNSCYLGYFVLTSF